MFLLFFFIFYEMCDENTYRQRRINRQPDFRGGLKTIAWFSFFALANRLSWRQIKKDINRLLIKGDLLTTC